MGSQKPPKTQPSLVGKMRFAITAVKHEYIENNRTALVFGPIVGLSGALGGLPKASENTAQPRGKDAPRNYSRQT